MNQGVRQATALRLRGNLTYLVLETLSGLLCGYMLLMIFGIPEAVYVVKIEKSTARHEVEVVLQQATRCHPTVLETPLLSPDAYLTQAAAAKVIIGMRST